MVGVERGQVFRVECGISPDTLLKVGSAKALLADLGESFTQNTRAESMKVLNLAVEPKVACDLRCGLVAWPLSDAHGHVPSFCMSRVIADCISSRRG